MATEEQINAFMMHGEVGEMYPYIENLPEGNIKDWSPDPEVGDFHLCLSKIEDTANQGNWYGCYTDLGDDWSDTVKEFFRKLRLDYVRDGQYLQAIEIPDVFGEDDWKIVEFGVAKFISGKLITRVRWEHDTHGRFMTAYSWPGC